MSSHPEGSDGDTVHQLTRLSPLGPLGTHTRSLSVWSCVSVGVCTSFLSRSAVDRSYFASLEGPFSLPLWADPSSRRTQEEEVSGG